MTTAAPRQAVAVKPLQAASTGVFLQRKCACGGEASGLTGECEECRKKKILGLQTKLRINEPCDAYEREADRVAEQVLAEPAHADVSSAPLRIQRYAGSPSGEAMAPASVDRTLASPGSPLEPALRRDMEQRFGHDFSRVRVHSGTAAEQSAQDVNAYAYTAGHSIVFKAGRFDPRTYAGRALLAHELTHVIQQRGAGSASPIEHSIQRKPAPQSHKKRVIAIHAEPHKLDGARAYVAGEPGSIEIILRKNELDQGSYGYLKRDLPQTAFEEYEREDHDGRAGFVWRLPKGMVGADRIAVEIQPGEFNLDTYAKAEFDAVPERIKSRLVMRGGRQLKTPEEQLGFANFARRLQERGVTDEELALFQNRAQRRPGLRRLDWANEWMQAADIVIGARAALENESKENVKEFQERSAQVPDIPEEVYKLYRISRLMPDLGSIAEEKMEELGVSIGQLEGMAKSLMEPFDLRLRLETNAALDRLEGGLLLTRERFVRDKGAKQKIAAMRAAANSSEVQALKSRKQQADRAKDDARRAYMAKVIGAEYSIDYDTAKDAEKAMDAASAAYEEARRDYLHGLEKVSGVPVASWRGFNIEDFFYGKAEDRSVNLLEGYIAQTLRDMGRARRELEKDTRTIYKADMMIQLTKDVLGVQKGSTIDRLIDDRVEECKSAPFWERLLDILSLALIFVPGGALVTAARLGISITQTIASADKYVEDETLYRVSMKQEGGSALEVGLNMVGSAADVGDVARALKGASTALKTEKAVAQTAEAASRTEATLAKQAHELPAPHVAPDAPFPGRTTPHVSSPELPVHPPEAPATASHAAAPRPHILDTKPTYESTEDAFASLKQELKDVPEGTGPVKGQNLGRATPGQAPVSPTGPRREFTQAERDASREAEARMAANKKKDALDELERTAPDVHAEVVKPSVRMQSGETVADIAARNPERIKELHKEWLDGIAKGKIKKDRPFSAYVKRRLAGDRGQAGEYLDAFVRGPDEIMVKAPKAKSNVRGTDSMSYRPSDRRIRYLDNKSVRPETTIGKVSALEKNLPQNMADDISDLERAIRDTDVPEEITNDVLPRLKSAHAELEEYIRKAVIRPEDMYSPRVRDAFDSILRNHGIERVVTFAGAGPSVGIGKSLSDVAGFMVERP
jgi:hypothetical protein